MLTRNHMLPQHLGQTRQVFVSETSSALRDRFKRICLLVVSCKKQRAISSRTFPPAVKSADHYKVHRILHLTLVISFVLYPQPPTCSSLVNRVCSNSFADNAFASVGDGFLEKLLQLFHALGDCVFGAAHP